MATLYQISENYRKFNEYANGLLENEEGIEEETLEMLIETLDSIDESFEQKAENISKLLKTLQQDEAAYKAEKDRLAKREKATSNTIEGLKRYTKEMLELAGKQKVKAGVFTLGLQNNPPSVDVFDEVKIPEKYREPQPDKILRKEIMNDLKLGIDVPGAKIADQTQSLRIR